VFIFSRKTASELCPIATYYINVLLQYSVKSKVMFKYFCEITFIINGIIVVFILSLRVQSNALYCDIKLFYVILKFIAFLSICRSFHSRVNCFC